mmetsp:Transcript_3398/g.8645  ORF Transcript_3398/g.8645 Transcript_3398/m.8645 type:complete len:112 (-) Transcript_3398:114-449(-)
MNTLEKQMRCCPRFLKKNHHSPKSKGVHGLELGPGYLHFVSGDPEQYLELHAPHQAHSHIGWMAKLLVVRYSDGSTLRKGRGKERRFKADILYPLIGCWTRLRVDDDVLDK